MGRLRAQQRGAAVRRPAPPTPERARAQLAVAEAACVISACMLASYAEVLQSLLLAGEPAGQQPRPPQLELVLRAVSAGVQYMWHVLHLLPPTAAALAVVAQALANETETDDHPMGRAIIGFDAVVGTTGDGKAGCAACPGQLCAWIGLTGSPTGTCRAPIGSARPGGAAPPANAPHKKARTQTSNPC